MAKLLAFVDLCDQTTPVAKMAREIAGALRMNLILMRVSNPDAAAEGAIIRSDISREGVAAEMRRYHRQLQVLARECSVDGIKASALLVRGRSIRGNPVPQMIRELKRIKPALIVMGTHQHGRLFEAMFGSASSRVIHNASCPILLVPSPRGARATERKVRGQ
jgi:nucleotide-binding universal stress UspA family protein